MENENYKIIQVITTVDKEEKAREIARKLVESRLVACVQMWPVTSIYSWQSKLHTDPEFIMQIKTIQDNFSKIEKWIETHHPYDTPELIAVPVFNVSFKYKEWVVNQCIK